MMRYDGCERECVERMKLTRYMEGYKNAVFFVSLYDGIYGSCART